ncbi:MAG: type II secretion system protein [Erysipelotrichaceae bacterium]|nr:type II secretion system protein [Erysipelotrichaceae bacterium]
MAKLKSNSGYTLTEMLIVLLVLGFMILTTPILTNYDFAINDFFNEYAYTQFKAIKDIKSFEIKNSYISNYHPISFNNKGNINISQTILLNGKNKNIKLTLLLGSGRLIRAK